MSDLDRLLAEHGIADFYDYAKKLEPEQISEIFHTDADINPLKEAALTWSRLVLTALAHSIRRESIMSNLAKGWSGSARQKMADAFIRYRHQMRELDTTIRMLSDSCWRGWNGYREAHKLVVAPTLLEENRARVRTLQRQAATVQTAAEIDELEAKYLEWQAVNLEAMMAYYESATIAAKMLPPLTTPPPFVRLKRANG